MSQSTNDVLLLNETNECSLLLKSIINTQKNLIVILHNQDPIVFNKAFLDFTGVSSVKEFLREFGSIPNRFVPHDSYFHAGKVDNPDEWVQALAALGESDRIVSMINCRTDPHAFSVTIDTPVHDYTIVTFTDISQDLIKRIMIENDVSIDKESGAYNKDYFIHTAKSFQDAAVFNKKSIAVTMIELMSSDTDTGNYLRDFTSSIKSNIRQSDMLVRWGNKTFLMAYLVETPDNAMDFSRKLFNVMKQEPFETLNSIHMHMGTTVQKEEEAINEVIKRAEHALQQSDKAQITIL